MMSLSKFSGGGGTPLRNTWLTSATGTFTPLADTTWFHIIMIGAGGAGGASGGGFYNPPYTTTGQGGYGGTSGQAVITWFKRESVSGTPIATYSYTIGTSSGLNSTWNSSSAGTLGIITARGGWQGVGGHSMGGYNGGSGSTMDQGGAGESSILGAGGGVGLNALGYGAGGGGGAAGITGDGSTTVYSYGGIGSPGVIVLTEF